MPPVPCRLTQDRNHLIVCGDDALAYRVTGELTTNYGERVTVLLSARSRGHGPRPFRAVADLPRLLFGHKLGLVFLVLFGVLVAGFVLLATAGGFSPANALYLTFLDAAGAAVTDPALGGPEKVTQFLLTFDGMALSGVLARSQTGGTVTPA